MDENREHCNSEKQLNIFILKCICLQNENALYIAGLYKGFVS